MSESVASVTNERLYGVWMKKTKSVCLARSSLKVKGNIILATIAIVYVHECIYIFRRRCRRCCWCFCCCLFFLHNSFLFNTSRRCWMRLLSRFWSFGSSLSSIRSWLLLLSYSVSRFNFAVVHVNSMNVDWASACIRFKARRLKTR